MFLYFILSYSKIFFKDNSSFEPQMKKKNNKSMVGLLLKFTLVEPKTYLKVDARKWWLFIVVFNRLVFLSQPYEIFFF